MSIEVIDSELTEQRLNQLTQALGSGMFVHVRNMLHDMAASDVALILESSPPKTRQVLWQLIDQEQAGDILEDLGEELKDSLISGMTPEKVAQATSGMDTDDLAYILRSLPDAVYKKVLQSMSSQDRHRVEQALLYPDDTAGSIMNTDTVTLRPDVNIDVVLRYLRQRGNLPDTTDTLYVVDRNDHVLGGVRLADLLTCNPSETIRTIMDPELESIPVAMPDNEVAQLFERHDWISAPVVDEEQKLLGRITIDDVVDVIREDAEHSMMGMAGMDDDEDTFGPVMKSTFRRSLWLTINLFAALLAASVSNMFEGTLEQFATIAILMTIVPSMGGVAGNQTLALVIRGIALGHIGQSNSRWLIGKELAIGFLNGIMWSVLVFFAVWLWKDDMALGGLIGGAMLINMTVAGLAGASIPLILKKLNIDPALAGGMVLTTVTDVIGLFAFLGLATIFLM
ncbi:magnesium transporter [Shewanella sp. 1_MG-2023]|jgi:magnesium transporter|uniref:Magnesium transporter MgtE n=1 Tax=Shewanella electrodiphila TaxID=934143 RepID=A0ABT0KPG1_9GAMM|nr:MULTISPECIES: magnesium transporter [Shewanella]MCC4834048.1 magnesium transporter [Shewanella sp. 10N.7]MCL1045737.1 magnesium transporter [Shewanella electrodiphila]MDO6613506.1 magnesium transporter [Shewanella sp. 7_MG-2023]MDO6773336.1 magnesium transporter [Shewanella sp. 2_MG-2023]MDO6795987.1 magnesium transporter [Shewanella sp. 1_MG-2023]